MKQVVEFFNKLLDSSDWPPRWHCGKWSEFHGWLYIISDLLIWSAYFTIPIVIIRYISKRKGIRFERLYFLFAAFILACGATHFLDAVAFWIPAYRLNALVRLITGILSWTTVFYLVKLLPVAFSLKSGKELEAEIEQRKKAEKQYRESEEQIQTIFNAAPDAVIVIDDEGRIVKWNPKAETLFGWTVDEVIGKPLSAIIIPDRYRDAHKTGLSNFLKTGKATVLGKTIEIQALTKNNTEFDVALSISPTVVNGKDLFIGFVRDITEQKRAALEIRQLNETLEQRVIDRTAALERSSKEISDYKYALDESSIVAVTNQKGIINYVNDNFCRISKYSREELIGQDHRIINSGYHPKQFIHDLWITIANGKIWKGELKNKAKDGTYYWVGTTIVPFLDEEGVPYQYVTINADITERKQAEQALHESQQLLSAIIDNSMAVIYVKNLQGQYLLVNRRFSELFHLSMETALGKTDYDFFSKEQADAFRKMDVRTAAADHALTEEEIAPHDDGLHTYISVKSTLKDNNGKPYAIFGISTDITELKKVEHDLRKSLREISDYKFALDESSIIAITDQKGIIIYVNNNFCKISKYGANELIGQDHRIINSGYHPKEFIRDLWLRIANGKIWKGELKNKAKDGTYYWVDTTIVPFLNDHNKPYQYVAIRVDITQRKQAEEDIRILNEELEKRVKERTEEIESFSYSVSHDLRAPLRAVNGYARILEEDYWVLFDAEGKRLLGEVQNNAKKMGILIDDLLGFSRLGRKEIEKSFIDMDQLTEFAIIEINKTTAHHAEIKVSDLNPVMADYSLMQHVMINLISNAIKYSSKKDKPVVEIKSQPVNGEFIYSVTDNGVGFDMEYVDKLFGVFQRLHSSEEFSGTGVGLAIVQRIIQKHNGRVWAEGKIDGGATFYFTLPSSA